MPFFSRQEQQPAPVVQEQQPRKHGLFSSHHEPAPVVQEQQPKKHGLFGRARSPSPVSSRSSNSYNGSPQRHSTDGSGKRSGGLLSKFGSGGSNPMDPSIVQARERVMHAETSERNADRALLSARESVRQAREEVRRLEIEAQEEARLAKIKQHHARDISKRGKNLGRHGI